MEVQGSRVSLGFYKEHTVREIEFKFRDSFLYYTNFSIQKHLKITKLYPRV